MNGENLKESQANVRKSQEAKRVLDTALSDKLRRGFYGKVSVHVSIQDGTIQEIEEQLERTHR